MPGEGLSGPATGRAYLVVRPPLAAPLRFPEGNQYPTKVPCKYKSRCEGVAMARIDRRPPDDLSQGRPCGQLDVASRQAD